MTRLANKIALITGASRGMGRATAPALAAAGAVVHFGRNANEAKRVVDQIRAAGGRARYSLVPGKQPFASQSLKQSANYFDADQAGRQLLKELQDVTTLQLPAPHHLADDINAMHLEDRLSDVETDGRNRLHDLAPPNRGMSAGTHIHGTDVPVEEPSTASEAAILRVATGKHVTPSLEAW